MVNIKWRIRPCLGTGTGVTTSYGLVRGARTVAGIRTAGGVRTAAYRVVGLLEKWRALTTPDRTKSAGYSPIFVLLQPADEGLDAFFHCLKIMVNK